MEPLNPRDASDQRAYFGQPGFIGLLILLLGLAYLWIG